MKMEFIRALVVEDNPADAAFITDAVNEAGANSFVELVHTGRLKSALRLIAEEKFDLILLDLHLPDGRGGLETLLQVQAASPSLPIIVLTGMDDEALATRAVREGAQDYLVKGELDGRLLVRSMRYATERKHAIEALQRREEHFRLLIENALDLITILHLDGTIRYVSPSHQRILGYKAEELIGVNVLTMLHPDDLDDVRAALRSPRRPASIECRFRHANGSWRMLEAFGRNLSDVPGVQGVVVNSRDVTERRQSEEALREANQTLRAVFHTSPLAIYTTGLDGCIKNWNRAAQKMFGWAEWELLESPLPQFALAPDEIAELRRKNAEGDNNELPVELSCRRKDGTSLEVRVWSAFLRDRSGIATGIVDVAADVTDRRRLEEQLHHSQRLDAVGRLAGGIAHDINNMLMVISGYSQMLTESLSGDQALQGDLEQIVKAADRGADLTRQLLAFSRRQAAAMRVLDLNSIVRDTERMLQRVIGEHIQLIVDLDPAVPNIRIDSAQLEQVLVNLAVNSRDAMSGMTGGGTLTIRTAAVHLDEAYFRKHLTPAPGHYARLTVSDTGAGVPPELEPHLFEPFYTTKERGKGTGLGLSTSYGIIKQSAGEIVYEPVSTGGAAFHIFLPAAQMPPLEEAHSQEPPKAELGSGTILLVEDDHAVRQVLESMLHRSGYTVLPYASPREALEFLSHRAHEVDLMITDMVMPGMSGPELVAASRLPNLPVLFVSGYADSVGQDIPGPHLQKPFTLESLALKVREALAASAHR
jgi:two-component system, cell cycle sensor histidine kinase and response regulator CckA